MRKGPPPVPKASAVDNLLWQIKHIAPWIPWPSGEYRFHPSRDFRFDLCWPTLKVAIEIDGGIWNYGRHNRAVGLVTDMQKGNEAVVCGYRVLHFRPEEVIDSRGRTMTDAIDVIVRLFSTLGFVQEKEEKHGRQVRSGT